MSLGLYTVEVGRRMGRREEGGRGCGEEEMNGGGERGMSQAKIISWQHSIVGANMFGKGHHKQKSLRVHIQNLSLTLLTPNNLSDDL